MGFFLYPIFGEMVCRYTVSSFFRACSIPFSKVLSILKVVKDAEKLSFFLRLSGCLIKKRVSFLQKSVWHKDEEEKKVDWKKTDFSSIFFFLCSSSKGVWSASLFSKCGTWQPDPVEMSSTQGSAKPKGKFILIFHHYGWKQNSITIRIPTFFKKRFQKCKSYQR